jgi:hypothetical protein
MVAPVSGLQVKDISLNGPPNSFGYKPVHLTLRRTWYRQERPYNLPLPFTLAQKRIMQYATSDLVNYQTVSTGVHTHDLSLLMEQTYNLAYEKLRNKILGEEAQLANAVLERVKTLESLHKRVTQLIRFTKAVKKFQWDEAAVILGFKRDQKSRVVNLHNLRTSAKAFGDNWLEFHFGWEPLVGEIGRCVELLQGDYPALQAYGKQDMPKNTANHYFNSGFNHVHDLFSSVKVRVATGIKITNPNLFLADQFGVVNPASVVWEAIPFSFAVDWFVNVGEFLNSWYPFPGCTLINPYRTYYRTTTQNHLIVHQTGAPYQSWKAEEVTVTRAAGIVGPTLRIRPPKAVSAVRAATAVSLLTKLLKS